MYVDDSQIFEIICGKYYSDADGYIECKFEEIQEKNELNQIDKKMVNDEDKLNTYLFLDDDNLLHATRNLPNYIVLFHKSFTDKLIKSKTPVLTDPKSGADHVYSFEQSKNIIIDPELVEGKGRDILSTKDLATTLLLTNKVLIQKIEEPKNFGGQ